MSGENFDLQNSLSNRRLAYQLIILFANAEDNMHFLFPQDETKDRYKRSSDQR
jgi:hypothetical protein